MALPKALSFEKRSITRQCLRRCHIGVHVGWSQGKIFIAWVMHPNFWPFQTVHALVCSRVHLIYCILIVAWPSSGSIPGIVIDSRPWWDQRHTNKTSDVLLVEWNVSFSVFLSRLHVARINYWSYFWKILSSVDSNRQVKEAFLRPLIFF